MAERTERLPAVAVKPMQPFFFGPRHLYGCFHPAAQSSLAAVICSPIGHEYVLAHRALRLLATKLSKSGIPTLRFDYSGCGDSAGALDEARIAHWTEDVSAATEALATRTGKADICLIGVRLGASLAVQAAHQDRRIRYLALWDPIERGEVYLHEMRLNMQHMLRIAHVRQRKRFLPDDCLEIPGYLLGPGLVRDLEAMNLERSLPRDVQKVLLVESGEPKSTYLEAGFGAAACEVKSHMLPNPNMWRWREDFAQIQLAHAFIGCITEWASEQVP